MRADNAEEMELSRLIRMKIKGKGNQRKQSQLDSSVQSEKLLLKYFNQKSFASCIYFQY